MPTARPGIRSLVPLSLALAVLLAGALLIRERLAPRRAGPKQGGSATTAPVQPTDQRSTAQTQAPRSYLDLLRRAYPSYPTTQPLDESLSLDYAGHFVIHDPVFLDNTGRLWITRADAEATETVLARAAEEQVILTRERPVYVHWSTADNNETPYLVCVNAKGDGHELVGASQRWPIGEGTKYDWARARYWDERIVVPTDVGVSVFAVGRGVQEAPSPPLAKRGERHAPVQITFSVGPLAWIPPQDGHPGSAGALRCVENAWFVLGAESGWPSGLMHLIPLLDGSVLQLVAGEGNLVKLSVVPLDPMSGQEERRIAELIEQLSDPEAEKRTKAFEELTRYGPGLWPIAEKLIDGEPPETQARLRDLLRSRVNPLLGGMQLVDGRMRVVRRYPDGGVLFYAERGVSIPQGEDQPLVVAPAWLSALPGDSIRLLPRELMRDLDVSKSRLTPWQDTWIVADDMHGPRRFFGGALVPMLQKDEKPYSEFVGMARGGRFVFSTPAQAPRPATQPAASQFASSPSTLIIDPRLPDPRPRLPVWLIAFPEALVGWDQNHWPAAKRKSTYALGAKEWRMLDDAKDKFYSTEFDVPNWPALPTTRPLFQSTTRPTTLTAAPTTQTSPDQTPILADNEGTYYFDGAKSLKLLRRDGTSLVWPLPPNAVGEGEVYLIRTGDGLLFLFNQPGRVLRVRPTPHAVEPFAVDAAFTKGVPSVEHATRIWLDPFGRIVVSYDGTRLAIMFPQGYIPPAIVNLMLAEDQRDAGGQ